MKTIKYFNDNTETERKKNMSQLLKQAKKSQFIYNLLLDTLEEDFKKNPQDPVVIKIIASIRHHIWPDIHQLAFVMNGQPICQETFQALKANYCKFKTREICYENNEEKNIHMTVA